MEPLDLTKRAPRSPREKLGGLVLLARTIDKLRAALPGGDLGRYLVFGGQSKLLADRLDIDMHELLEVVRQAKNDDDVVAWVRRHSNTAAYAAINEFFENRVQADVPAEGRALFESNYSVAMREKHQRMFDLLEADDAELFGGP